MKTLANGWNRIQSLRSRISHAELELAHRDLLVAVLRTTPPSHVPFTLKQQPAAQSAVRWVGSVNSRAISALGRNRQWDRVREKFMSFVGQRSECAKTMPG